jgi:hypothetical protein
MNPPSRNCFQVMDQLVSYMESYTTHTHTKYISLICLIYLISWHVAWWYIWHCLFFYRLRRLLHMWRWKIRNLLIKHGLGTIIQISKSAVISTSLYHWPMSSVEVWGSITLLHWLSLSLKRWDWATFRVYGQNSLHVVLPIVWCSLFVRAFQAL